ncbi:MAG: endolytic transglycosylase MltG [Elusimicrobiales bacterium]|nr:endolytic transglycosylase MltG [Elusimicrobiales bacterium]
MRKIKTIAITAALLFCALSLYFFWPGRPVKVSIPEGAGAGKVAAALKAQDVILSSTWFRVLVKLTGTGKKLMPGEYALRERMSAEEALWKMTHSTYVSSIRIVLPEGWRMEQVAERLEANGVTPGDKFLALAREQKLEGYLFPSTYNLKKNMPPQEVINLLKLEFDRQILPLFSKGFPEKLDARKVVIIASIVEREAMDDSERPLIAAVYTNRYRRGMPLEADPTTQYALGYNQSYGWWKKALTYKDLKFKSPYNTYVVGGLPPGPICNPGYNSIAAALEPANLDALYFVADRKGKHIFNANFEEHKKAKRRVEALAKESSQPR